MTIQKWPLQRDCDAFYGNPRGASGDVASPEWEAENLVYVLAPWDLRMGSIKLKRGIRVHRLVAESLTLILEEIWEVCGRDTAEIKRIGMDDCGGGYNYRLMRNKNVLSMHAWGCAVDFDPDRNGLGNRKPAMDLRVVAIFEKHEWEWGGHWLDGMHFQAAWTVANPKRLGAKAIPVASVGQPTTKPSPSGFDYEVKALQERLQTLGYSEVGRPDGFMGSRTVAGISAFQHEAGLAVTGKMDDATKAALVVAGPRVIGEARATATAADLKASNPVVKKASMIQTGAKAATFAAGFLSVSDVTSDPIGAAQTAADKATQAAGIFGQMQGLLAGAWAWASSHPLLFIGIGVAAGCWVLHGFIGSMIEAAVERHRSGADTGA